MASNPVVSCPDHISSNNRTINLKQLSGQMTEKQAWQRLESDLENCHKLIEELVADLCRPPIPEHEIKKKLKQKKTADQYCKQVYQDVDLLKNTKWG